MSVERVACPKCGSNNFATQARCWSCGTALTAGAASAPAAAYAPAPPAALAPPRAQQYSGLAAGATAALGLLFPAISVPVGLIFLMLDDRRKAQIGWLNILWGTIGTLVHIFATMALYAMITPMLLRAATGLTGQARQNIEQRTGGVPQGFPGFPPQ